MRAALVLVALAACSACAPAAAQAPAEVLLNAFRAAESFDPTYGAARQEQLAAREGIELAAGALRPEAAFTGNGSYNNLDQTMGAVSRSPRYWGGNVGVVVRQPILNPELESRETLARLRARQLDAVLEVRRLELSERLVDAYVQLAYAGGLVELGRDELRRQQLLVHAAQRSLAGGEGTTTEVLEAVSRADLLQAQLQAAEATLEEARESLRALTGPGVDLGTPRFSGRPLSALPAVAAPAAVDAALAAHPEVRAREAAVELARENINLARAPYRSRLDWSVGASRGDSDGVNSVNQKNRLGSISMQWNVPLYSGGRDDAATRQAVLLVGKAQADLDEAREALRLKVLQALRGLASSRQRWQALQSAKDSSRQLISATNRSIAGGVRSRLDLLLAERQLVQVLREEQAALAEYLRAWWRATTARGEAGEAELRLLATAIEMP